MVQIPPRARTHVLSELVKYLTALPADMTSVLSRPSKPQNKKIPNILGAKSSLHSTSRAAEVQFYPPPRAWRSSLGGTGTTLGQTGSCVCMLLISLHYQSSTPAPCTPRTYVHRLLDCFNLHACSVNRGAPRGCLRGITLTV